MHENRKYVGLLHRRLICFLAENGLIKSIDLNVKLDEELVRRACAVMSAKRKNHVYRDYKVFFCDSCGVWACQFYTFQECKTCLFKFICEIKKGESTASIICEDCTDCKSAKKFQRR